MREEYEGTVRLVGEAVREGGLQEAMRLIQERHPKYEWVGVYVLREAVLELGPYVGKATVHTRIPVGKGVCGTAVATGENQVIEDVLKLGNYIACSDSVRSEIVVLIRDGEEVLAQIDADCDEVGAFTAEDEEFLEAVAEVLVGVVREGT